MIDIVISIVLIVVINCLYIFYSLNKTYNEAYKTGFKDGCDFIIKEIEIKYKEQTNLDLEISVNHDKL
jgi:hypothetical protein